LWSLAYDKKEMNSFILVVWLSPVFFVNIDAASQNKLLVEGDRLIALTNTIETGKSINVETNRHMHLSWDSFRQLINEYKSKFDELICTDREKLTEIHIKLSKFSKEVELGWKLKQEQLDDLADVLHHENYNATGLSTGNEGVDYLCQGLDDYIHKVNRTAWEDEKPELDKHLQEVIDIRVAIESHPCPCVWSAWNAWSHCSTTCELGYRNRKRVILKEAVNNGTGCDGPDEQSDVCNDNVCCPVNCVWSSWGEWNACPSGCYQRTTRTRTKDSEAKCGGIDCSGMDYMKKPCSREIELEEKITILEERINQCQGLDECVKVKRNHELRTVDKWGPTFHISFSFLIKQDLEYDTWLNFLHLTKGTNGFGDGTRLPGIWFIRQSGKGNLMYVAHAYGEGQKVFEHQHLETNRWYDVRISQGLKGIESIGDDQSASTIKVMFTVYVGGKRVWELELKNPEALKEYRDVKVYLSDPWHESIEDKVCIRDLLIEDNHQLIEEDYPITNY